MTSSSSQNEGYLAEQLKKAGLEFEGLYGKSEDLKQEVEQYEPLVTKACRDIENKLQQLTKNKIEQIHQEARQESLAKALTLSPIVKGFPLMILWGVLAGLFFFVAGWIGKLIAIGLYIVLVKKAISRAAIESSKSITTGIERLGHFQVTLMHFGEKESGDSTYPYSVIRAPWALDQISTQWRIDQKYGAMFNQNFVALHFDDDMTKQYVVIQIPKDNAVAQIIDINANSKAEAWPQHVALLQDLATQVKTEVQSIEIYAEQAEAWQHVEQQKDLLFQRMATLKDVELNWSDISLEEETLDRILKLVDMFKSGRKPSPKGILLYGPPGTGKTLIARKLARHSNCHFEAVNIADLKGTHIGQTAPKIKELWQRCRDNAPTILFVDECESAFAKRGGTDNDSFGNELVQTFISEWDGFNQASGQVFVIGATNRKDILDTAVLSRFTASIELGLPNDKSRRKILANEFKQADLDFEISNELVTETAGMSGRDIHTMVATLIAENFNSDINSETIAAQIRKIRGKGSTQIKTLTWDDIILPQNTLNEFQSLGKELRNAERLAEIGIATPKGILLYGPPGTGKTQIARVLAGQSGLSFIAVTTSDLKANYIGQSGSKVKQLFEQARSQAPCILFIDEIDIIAGSRGGNTDSFVQEIVGQLLQEIDGVASKAGQVFLLAASNHPDNIDSALLSRLERKIEIGLPHLEARQKILALLLSKKPIDFDLTSESIRLAELTEGYSGRDLDSLVTRATRKAVNRAMTNGEDIENIKIISQDFDENTAS